MPNTARYTITATLRTTARRYEARSLSRGRVTLVLAVAIVFPVAWVAVTQLSGPDDGTLLNPHMSRSQARQWTVGVPVQRVYGRGGFRPGDVVIAIGGRSVATLAAWNGPRRHAGALVRYTLLRRGERIEATVRLRRFDLLGGFTRNWQVYVVPLVLLAVAAFVFVQRPGERPAQLMLAVGAFLVAGTAEWPLGLRAIDFGGGRGVWPYVGSDIANALMWASFLHFALVFPTPPRPLVARPWLAGGCYLLPFALYGLGLSLTLPHAHVALARLEQLTVVSEYAARVVPALLIVLFVFAYRRTTEPADRRRLRYVVGSLIGALVVYLLAGQLPDAVFGEPLIGWDTLQLAFVICPLAIAAAILRWQLFDIQVILKRSLVFGLLSGTLLLISFAVLVALTHWFPSSSPVVAVAVGSAVALCFHPLRRKLRVWVGGLIFGARDDPYTIVSELARLDPGTNPHAALQRIVETLAATLRLTFVAVELASAPDVFERAAVTGRQDGGALVVVPLGWDDRASGRLVLEVMAGREPFGPADRRLLDDVSRQVSRLTDLVLLNAALRESRTRIITAREEERRRLHRDLHDGLGPTLAAQAMQLDVARTMLARDSAGAEEILSDVATETKAVIGELRRVVDDLRPKALDQLGLVSGIQERCNRFSHGRDGAGLQRVDVIAPAKLPELPAAVEVAAYRIAMEAVTNAARHGRARTCRVEIAVEDDVLTLVVRDDGVGLPSEPNTGIGLGSMRERAAELGGSFSAEEDPAGGTVISAVLPFAHIQADAVAP